MNLSQLRFVSAVASKGTFTAAADECHVTQPTLSNGIAKLEDELGARLFVRTTRKVRLTPYGLHLLPYVDDVLNAQTTLVSQSKAFLQPNQRLIRIGTSPLLNSTLLGLMLEPYRREHSNVDVVLREMNMADLHRMLDAGLLDYVFGVVDGHKERWMSTPLYDEALLFIPPGAGELTGGRLFAVKISDISHETYVMVPDACGLARATRALFRSQRCKLNEYPGEAMGYQVLEEWAALKIGAAILPQSKITDKHHAAYPIDDKSGKAIRISFDAVWVRDKSRPGHLLAFEQHLRKVAPSVIRGISSHPLNADALESRSGHPTSTGNTHPSMRRDGRVRVT